MSIAISLGNDCCWLTNSLWLSRFSHTKPPGVMVLNRGICAN